MCGVCMHKHTHACMFSKGLWKKAVAGGTDKPQLLLCNTTSVRGRNSDAIPWLHSKRNSSVCSSVMLAQLRV